MSVPQSPLSVATNAEAASEVIARLRAELDAAESDEIRGLLLYELGVLEERVGNETQAARDLLGSVNVIADFVEPLECLIVLIDRRKSYKNLGKLLDRLCKIVEQPEERSRALVAHAAFLDDHQLDSDGAIEALKEACQVRPDDAVPWLALELLAAKRGDTAIRQKALRSRAELAQNPQWKALLWVDLARLLAADDFGVASQACETAIQVGGPATFGAWLSLERMARDHGRDDVVARALEAQADLAFRAAQDGEAGDALGVPRSVRSIAYAAEAWLAAASVHQARGDSPSAVRLLDRALEHASDEPAVVFERLRAAEASGDTETTARLARAEIERGVDGAVAASLWLRVAEAAASSGEVPPALEALLHALEAEPKSVPARALQLDFLGVAGTPEGLATAFEAAAQHLSEPGAARFYLIAADIWAREAGDTSAARAALSQAVASGLSPVLAARAGRLLAAVTGDAAWYEESTRRLLMAGAGDDERAGLWFELARGRLLRNDLAGATEALSGLAQSAGGRWLGLVLRAYGVPVGEGDQEGIAASVSALRELAIEAPDPAVRRALRLAGALRGQLAGDAGAATTELEAIHADDPTDLVAATALATLLRREGQHARAAEVLATCAARLEDPKLGASFALEAGIVLWAAENRIAAVAEFEAAAERAPAAASAILAWALRSAQPNDLNARRRAIEAADSATDQAALALERFALELGEGGAPAAAATALESVSPYDGGLSVGADLARGLWTQSAGEERRLEALERLSAHGRHAAALAACSAHELTLAMFRASNSIDTVRQEVTAERWAKADPSPAAALEWLAAAIANRNFEGEVAARSAAADRLQGGASAAMSASARIVAQLAYDVESQPLLDSSYATAKFANLEIAPPGVDPRRRAVALTSAASALDDDSPAVAACLCGYNLLAVGDNEGAAAAFRVAVRKYPSDLAIWEGLRMAAEALGDRRTLAEANGALGDAMPDGQRGAEYWEIAASIYLDELHDNEGGEFALGRAVECDINRFSTFDRLFRLVRARRDGPRMLELIDARLEVADDPEELAKLFWERARVLRQAGDSAGALQALENVTLLEPDHVGALALTGEIFITEKRFAEAAEKLARLSMLSDAPKQQRLMSGIAAVDLYENRLDQGDEALDVLVGLHQSGLATPPVRERLARVAAKMEDWPRATEILESLMNERDTAEGRIAAARLALAIYRDRLNAPERALAAAERLLKEAPADGEALDLVLSGPFAAHKTTQLLRDSRDAAISELLRNPLDVESVGRVAEIARVLNEAPLRQVALGALVVLGRGTRQIENELSVLDERVARMPAMAIDHAAIARIRDPEDQGALAPLMKALAPLLAEALGPGLATFGVSRKDRVRPKDGLPVRNEIAAWAGALGVGEFELYVGGRDHEGVFGIPLEVPELVIGTGVQAPLSPRHRAAVARELLAIRLGTSILRHRDATDIAALVVAACRLGGVIVESPAYAMLGEFERQLSKEAPRKLRKLLTELAPPVAGQRRDPIDWVNAATASLDRMAAIAVGDVSWILLSLAGERGRPLTSEDAKARASRLLSFVFSRDFFAVREQLGMGVR